MIGKMIYGNVTYVDTEKQVIHVESFVEGDSPVLVHEISIKGFTFGDLEEGKTTEDTWMSFLGSMVECKIVDDKLVAMAQVED